MTRSTHSWRARGDASIWRRLFWFAAFWLLGVGALTLVAYAIRLGLGL